jgi:D-alanyl-D-alanine carboxypeptidase (penicillin-binding protein 5/6)
MQAKTFSLLPIALAVAAGSLMPSSASFAAKHHAAKPAAHKKASAAAANALPMPSSEH